MKKIFIRSIKFSDKEEWQKLYQGYAIFYKVEMTQTILNTVWSWLIDEQHELNGLICEFEEKIVAFAHYRRMPSPLRGEYIGFYAGYLHWSSHLFFENCYPQELQTICL